MKNSTKIISGLMSWLFLVTNTFADPGHIAPVDYEGNALWHYLTAPVHNAESIALIGVIVFFIVRAIKGFKIRK